MRVMNINFYDHQMFGTKSIKFCNKCDGNNHVSIIIGKNGSGKSTLLRELVDILRENRNLRINKKRNNYTKCNYELNYYVNEKNVCLRKNRVKEILVNNDYMQEDEDIFPNHVISVCLAPNDKFAFSRNDPFYIYSGLRQQTNYTDFRSVIKTVVCSLAETDFKKVYLLKNIFSDLGLKNELWVEYNNKRMSLIKSFSSIEALDDYFRNWRKRSNRKTVPFSASFYELLSEKEKQDLLVFITNAVQEREKLNLFCIDDFIKFKQVYPFYSLLNKLDLTSAPTVYFMKDIGNSYIELDENQLSSGEYNLILQFIKIVAYLDDNSLLLIDEPEISLHPNWQVMYLDYLDKILSEYRGVHVVISTHSHMMLSNIHSEYSSLVTINKDGNFELLDYSVNGWSPENILYNVFSVSGYRNTYLERDIRELIHFIENPNSEDNRIIPILDRIDKFNLSDDDPLAQVIIEARRKYVNGHA